VVLAAGATFVGNFVLPRKAGTGWIVIRSDGAVPPAGVRATPAAAAVLEAIAALGGDDVAPRAAAALERLAAAVTVEEVRAGAVLIREGDPADSLWVLVEGRLGVTSTTQRGAIPDVLAPDVVGELGVLRRSARTATVTTDSPVTLWRLSAGDYLDAVGPERVPLLLLGTANIRLHRTEPQPAHDAAAG
jgi:CRP-like cAMP-binding protein